MVPFDRLHTSSYSSSMAVSGIVFEIQQCVGRKTPILYRSFHLTIRSPRPLRIFFFKLIQTSQLPNLLDGAKILPKILNLWVPATISRTDDRRTAHAIR